MPVKSFKTLTSKQKKVLKYFLQENPLKSKNAEELLGDSYSFQNLENLKEQNLLPEKTLFGVLGSLVKSGHIIKDDKHEVAFEDAKVVYFVSDEYLESIDDPKRSFNDY